MEIEDKIRARLETILTNDARNHAELASIAGGQLIAPEPFADERSFYERIINTYRSAVREVNSLFEENVAFLSGFSQLVDNVKDKSDFEVICSHLLDCVLQDFGAEFCSLLFFDEEGHPDSVSLEGTLEECKFLRIHSRPDILGSEHIQQVLTRLAAKSQESFIVDDVYREPDFARIDFPSVVRSIACIPLISAEKTAGLLVASHSRPKYFTDNHLRVLKILAGFAAHLRLLTNGNHRMPQKADPDPVKSADVISVALLDFQVSDALGGRVSPDSSLLSHLRAKFYRAIHGLGSVVFRGEREILVLLPGLPAKELHTTAGLLQQEFHQWKAEQNGRLAGIRMNLGYLTCDGNMDLERILEMIHLKMNPDLTEEPVGIL
jgi:hypothetical protein